MFKERTTVRRDFSYVMLVAGKIESGVRGVYELFYEIFETNELQALNGIYRGNCGSRVVVTYQIL